MVNKTKITGKNVFNGDQFGTKGNHESSYVEKKLFFGYFYRYVSRALILRPQNTYM